jgi:hypothetical protein
MDRTRQLEDDVARMMCGLPRRRIATFSGSITKDTNLSDMVLVVKEDGTASFELKKDVIIQYYSERRDQTIERTKKIEEELMAKVWHPDGAMFRYYCEDDEV